jgi:RNA polymerase sigma-70 factor (ECF subfamily)
MPIDTPSDPSLAEESASPLGNTDQMMIVVYEELRAIAARRLQQERSDHTLQPTSLVHEVYLRLSEDSSLQWSDRTHFLAIAAKCVRQVLISHARIKQAEKRGGGALQITLHEGLRVSNSSESAVDVLVLEELLNELGSLNERQMRVVELRYYGGMTVPEAAQILGVSARTVDCDWAFARAWLAERLFPVE